MRIADLDDDGKEEIILGAMALDHDGRPMWSIDRGHVDHVYVGEMNLKNPGKEVYFGTEKSHKTKGMGMVDAKTGKYLWSNDFRTKHIHREGLCADLIKSSPGDECYSGEAENTDYFLWSSDGDILSRENLGGLRPRAAFWDADFQKELIMESRGSHKVLELAIADMPSKKPVSTIRLDPPGERKKDLQYIRVIAVADILGDWREEIIAVNRGGIMILTTNIPAKNRHPWLMQDVNYRAGMATNSMGYYQQPSLSYHLESLYQKK